MANTTATDHRRSHWHHLTRASSNVCNCSTIHMAIFTSFGTIANVITSSRAHRAHRASSASIRLRPRLMQYNLPFPNFQLRAWIANIGRIPQDLKEQSPRSNRPWYQPSPYEFAKLYDCKRLNLADFNRFDLSRTVHCLCCQHQAHLPHKAY